MKKAPLPYLRQEHRCALWEGAVWAIAAALAVDLAAVPLGVEAQARTALLVLAVLTAALLRLTRRQTLRETACRLDARFSSRNRLEAVAELEERGDPLAAALRTEAEAYFSGQSLPRPHGFLVGCALLAALLVLRLIVTQPLPGTLAPASTAPSIARAEPAPVEPTAPVPPAASFRWLYPENHIRAQPDEIIPLSAEAASSTGLRRLTLHVSVNGTEEPPLLLPGSLASGTLPVAATLRLGTFRMQPFDSVTYYLTAERIPPPGSVVAPPWPEIYSPLQTIEITGSADRLSISLPGIGGNPGESDHFHDAVESLQSAERRVLEESFSLAHAPQAGAASESKAAMERLAADQAALSEEVRKMSSSISAGALAPGVRAALSQTQAEMNKAGAALAVSDPGSAVTAEERALAALPLLEKEASLAAQSDLRKRLPAAQAEATQAPSPSAPATPSSPAAAAQVPAAGAPAAAAQPAIPNVGTRLALLTQQQRALADQLAKGANAASLVAAEDKLARDLSQLASDSRLPSDVASQVQAAAHQAQIAAIQLNAGDAEAAKEPAARAAMTLNEASRGLGAYGHSMATQRLAAAQRLLIRAATAVRSPERSSRGAQIALKLTQQARLVLEKGSSNLLNLANKEEAAADAQEMRTQSESSGGQKLAQTQNALDTTASQLGGKDGGGGGGSPAQLRREADAATNDAQTLTDMDSAIGDSHIEADLNRLVQQGAAADPKDKEAAAQKLLALAQQAAGRISMNGDPQKIEAEATDNLRRDQANAQQAAKSGSGALNDLYIDAVANAQVASSAAARAKAESSQPPKDNNNSESSNQAGSGGGSASGAPGGDQPGGDSGGQGGSQSGSGSSGGSGAQPPGGGSPSGNGPSPSGSGQDGGGSQGGGSGVASGSFSPNTGPSGGQGAGAGMNPSESGSPDGGSPGGGGQMGGGSRGDAQGSSSGSSSSNAGASGQSARNPEGPSLAPASGPDGKAYGPSQTPGTPEAGTTKPGTDPSRQIAANEDSANQKQRVVNSSGRAAQAAPSTDNKAPGTFLKADGTTPVAASLEGKIGVGTPSAAALSEQLNGLIAGLELSISNTPRAQTLTAPDPADAPPAYRTAVSDYFEALAKAPSAAAPGPP